jgi:hypothetical protein
MSGAGYRAFCRSCIWDDGHFTEESAARAAATIHAGTNSDHQVEVEEWLHEGG